MTVIFDDKKEIMITMIVKKNIKNASTRRIQI